MEKTIIVSGVARSGITLMMQLLYGGGYPCFGEYPAFEDYEFGGIDYSEANGKAIKLVDTQRHFPPKGEYYVLLMKRDHKRQAKSHVKFLRRLSNLPIPKGEYKTLRKAIKKDVQVIKQWAEKQVNFIEIDFEKLISKPCYILHKINREFQTEITNGGLKYVKQRGPECYNGLLELEIIKEFNENKKK